MSCTLLVRNNDNTSQVIIPGKAVVEQMGEYFVYVAKDTTVASTDTSKAAKDAAQIPSLRAIQKKIVLGQAIADSVIVKAGLQDGDSVIIDGVQRLHDGSLLTKGNVAMPPNAAGKK